MRRNLCIFSLVAITLAATASDLFAQRIQFGGGRPGGISVNYGNGFNGGRYYGGRNYGGFYGTPYNYGGRYYSSQGYYTTPGYYYSDPVTIVPQTEIRPSNYSDPSVANITVLVPHPDAQVWFDNSATSQRGMERLFTTSGLQQAGTYTIKVQWVDNGRTVERQRDVQVHPGQSVFVNFQAEGVPSPQSK